jgi:hypothetical protein
MYEIVANSGSNEDLTIQLDYSFAATVTVFGNGDTPQNV